MTIQEAALDVVENLSEPDYAVDPRDSGHVVRIDARPESIAVRLAELWRYRELVYFFTWRDIKVRYKQTVLGASWAVLQPFLTMVVFTIFFGRLAGLPSDGVPYPLFSYAALVPWMFFANGLTLASNSMVGQGHIIKKVYFPRLAIPLSSVLSGVLDALIALIVLLVMMLAYGITPGLNILFVIPLFALAFVTCLAVGVWTAGLNVQFRDIRYTIPFVTQLWMFSTPIAYPTSLLSEPWRTIYSLNPMVGVVEGFRWALLGTDTAPGLMVVVSSCVSLGLLAAGVRHFVRIERTFADVV